MTWRTSSEGGQTLRVLRVFLLVLIAGVSVYLALLLFTGGFSWRVGGSELTAARLAKPVMLLSAMLSVWTLMTRRITSLEVLSRRGALVLALGALIIYLGNGRTLDQGDTIAAAYLPMSILREGNFDLQEFPFLYSKENWYWRFLEETNGRWVSKYPVGAAVLATPVYLLSALGTVSLNSPFIDQLAKLAAALIAALSVAIVHMAVRRLTTHGVALLITSVYALGTSTFSVSSQALWQHGPSQLAFSVVLYCLVRAREEPAWAGFAGLPMAFAVIARPTNALLAAPIALYTVIYHRRQLATFISGGFAPLLLQLWYNTTYYGTPFHSQFNPLHPGFFGLPLAQGLAGILVSPSRGLLVYSPALILSLVGLVAVWRRGGNPLFRAVAVGTVMGILLYGKFFIWWAGYTYGPRYLADFTPGLALLLVPILPVALKRRTTTAVFLVLTMWSMTAHAIGAYVDENRWNAFQDIPGIEASEVQDRLWRWRDNQFFNPVADFAVRLGAAMLHLPTSQTADWLRASYHTTLPASVSLTVGSPLSFSVGVTNAGAAVWLRRANHDRGVVSFGWRWLGLDGDLVGVEGRTPLQMSVLPGHRQELWPVIDPPNTPGSYRLEWGLVSEGVSWFPSPNQLDVAVLEKARIADSTRP